MFYIVLRYYANAFGNFKEKSFIPKIISTVVGVPESF